MESVKRYSAPLNHIKSTISDFESLVLSIVVDDPLTFLLQSSSCALLMSAKRNLLFWKSQKRVLVVLTPFIQTLTEHMPTLNSVGCA